METCFYALGSIPIFNLSLHSNLQKCSIVLFKNRLSVALSPSTTIYTSTGAFIVRSIIIPYEDDNTVIKYVAKSHIYCLAQPLVVPILLTK